MDDVDRKIASLVQADSRLSNAQLAEAAGVSVSTANERLRKLSAAGVITAWRAVLAPKAVGAGFCSFVWIDVAYEGEAAARAAIAAFPEVQEMHHVSGPHSYLLKVRVADTGAMQRFLAEKLKPLAGIARTETIVVLETVKETTEVALPDLPEGSRKR